MKGGQKEERLPDPVRTMCPVVRCGRDKFDPTDLVCQHHWEMVPESKQRQLKQLFKEERGSAVHIRFALDILRRLNADA